MRMTSSLCFSVSRGYYTQRDQWSHRHISISDRDVSFPHPPKNVPHYKSFLKAASVAGLQGSTEVHERGSVHERERKGGSRLDTILLMPAIHGCELRSRKLEVWGCFFSLAGSYTNLAQNNEVVTDKWKYLRKKMVHVNVFVILQKWHLH